MKKSICVPVDFSLNAFSAYHYATQLAHRIGGEVILINVINGSFNTNHALGYQPMKEIEKAVLERMKYFAIEYPHEVGVMIKKVPIKYEVRFGIPGFTIANYCKDNKIYLTIMGTRDKHGIFDKIMGTVSSTVIQLSPCPVLTVHENTSYVDLNRIVFGYGRDEDDVENAVDFIKDYNAPFGARIDFVHVTKDEEKSLISVVDEIVEEMLEDKATTSFEVKTIKGEDTSSSLIDYCMNNKADLLVLQHKKVSFFEGLFKRSISVKSAHSFHMPVLICPESFDN